MKKICIILLGLFWNINLFAQEVPESLIKEAYERSLYDIRASHILIKVSSTASPSDTIIAFNKINNIRKKILAGMDFGQAAIEFSEDTATAKSRYGAKAGDLGYFTALNMVYPFENVAFNTPVGQVSMPVRTIFGYHLIKVMDIKNAMNKVQVAHILLMYTPTTTAQDSINMKNKIQKVYKKIQEGIPFDSLVKNYSEDKGSAHKGGILPWFGVNRMVPEFIVAVTGLKNKGDVSEPFLSQYGWHIIKFIDRKPIGTYEEEKMNLKEKIARDSRSDLIIFTIDNIPYSSTGLISSYSVANTSIYNATYRKNYLDKYIMFKMKVLEAQKLCMDTTNAFKNELEGYHDKYKNDAKLKSVYYEGVLLYVYVNKNVWSRVSSDSLGMRIFYKNNKEKYLPKTYMESINQVKNDYNLFLNDNLEKTLKSKYTINITKNALLLMEKVDSTRKENPPINNSNTTLSSDEQLGLLVGGLFFVGAAIYKGLESLSPSSGSYSSSGSSSSYSKEDCYLKIIGNLISKTKNNYDIHYKYNSIDLFYYHPGSKTYKCWSCPFKDFKTQEEVIKHICVDHQSLIK